MEKIMVLDHLRACAERAKTFASGLVADLSKSTVDALEEMENLKADKQSGIPLTISTSGWATDGAAYPYYYDLAAEGVTVRDRAEIRLSPASMGTAKDCGLCPASETMAGKIRLRAASVPTEEITGEYWIEYGKE